MYGFLKILILRGKILKKKMLKILEIFEIFKIRDSSFVAPLIPRHFI